MPVWKVPSPLPKVGGQVRVWVAGQREQVGVTVAIDVALDNGIGKSAGYSLALRERTVAVAEIDRNSAAEGQGQRQVEDVVLAEACGCDRARCRTDWVGVPEAEGSVSLAKIDVKTCLKGHRDVQIGAGRETTRDKRRRASDAIGEDRGPERSVAISRQDNSAG